MDHGNAPKPYDFLAHKAKPLQGDTFHTDSYSDITLHGYPYYIHGVHYINVNVITRKHRNTVEADKFHYHSFELHH